MEDETVMSPVLAPKQKDGPKEEPADNSPLKTAPAGSARGTPSTSKSKAKKKSASDDLKTTSSAPAKKVKMDNTPSSLFFMLEINRKFVYMYLVLYCMLSYLQYFCVCSN